MLTILVVWKDLNWEQIKDYWWDLFIIITSFPAKFIDENLVNEKIDLTNDIQLLIITNIAFWILTIIIIILILILFYKIKSYFV